MDSLNPILEADVLPISDGFRTGKLLSGVERRPGDGRLRECASRCTFQEHMARRYSLADARSRLPTIVDEAEAGHEIELTRRGELVAVLVSRQTFDRLRGGRRQFKEAYRAFLERYPLDEIAVSDVREAFPRDRSTGRKVHL